MRRLLRTTRTDAPASWEFVSALEGEEPFHEKQPRSRPSRTTQPSAGVRRRRHIDRHADRRALLDLRHGARHGASWPIELRSERHHRDELTRLPPHASRTTRSATPNVTG